MKFRIGFVVTVAIALALCFTIGIWPTSQALAAGADDTGVTSKEIVQEYSANTTLNAATIWNGNVRVDSGVTLDLNGNSLTITGNLEVFGTLHINNGSLIIKSGSITIDGGLLQMTQDSTTTGLTNPNTVTVSGSFIANGKDETGNLTAGKITVKGNFIQYNIYSNKSFCPTGTVVALSGAGKYVSFDSPANSWLGAYDFASGISFNSQSIFSFNLNLSNATNDFSAYPHLYIQGKMNGKALTVPAGTFVEGPLTLGGGQLTCKGALTVDYYGGISMTNALDKITVNGDLITGGICNCQAGTVEITGNFKQYGVVKGFHDNSWVCSPTNVTKIIGANRTVNFDSPATSCFGQLNTSAGSITTGSTLSLNFDLSGDTSLAYTVASIYYGGHLNGHKLTVPNSPFFAARQIVLGGGTLDVSKSFTASEENSLIMTNASDHVIARGDFTSSGKMDATSITAGKIDLYGNFTQTGNPASFIASGTNLITLFKANTTVQFNNPGQSWFGKLALNTGASLNATSTLSMKCNLDMSQTYTVRTLYYGGSLSGNNLTVNGDLHIVGNTDIGTGTLKATGTVALDGALTMANISGKLEADGDFTGAGTAALIAGSAEFKGGFHYSGTSYQASAAHSTVLSGGPNMAVIFDHPAQSYFAAITLSSGTTLSSSSVLSVKTTGLSNMSFNVPHLYLQGDLGGKTVTLTGSVTVPSGEDATLNINGGILNVSGDMVLDGLLVMKKAADVVTVGGSFTAQGPDETDKLTDGKLTIKGNFSQLSPGNSYKSFAASGNHATILAGTALQHVSFASPSLTTGSAFAKLYNMNPTNVAFDNPYYALSYAIISNRLNSLTGTGGTLIPVFSKDVTNYIYLLAKGTDQATISADSESQSPNATMTMNGNSVKTINITGVPYNGNSPVQIVVTTLDGVAQRTYTVKVEQLNVDLSGISVSSGSLAPAFDAAVTSYTLDIPAAQQSVTITPTAANPDTTFTINGAAASSVLLSPKPGETLNAEINLTGQDGTSTRKYTVAVHRAQMLSGISASAGIVTADSNTAPTSFTLNLGVFDSSATITPQTAGAGITYTIDAVNQASATYSLDIGEQRNVTIVATAGSAQYTYIVHIIRASVISGFGLSPSAGTSLTPSFNPKGGNYTLTVPASLLYLTVTPPRVNCTKLTINGVVNDSVTLSPDSLPPGGSVTLTISAEYNTLALPFQLTITKSPIITNILPSEGTLTQKADPTKHTFDPTVTEYSVDLSATDDPISVTPTLLSGSVTINGHPWDADNPLTVSPAPGATSVLTVVGTSGSGTATYKINIVRHKPVSAITLSTGSLSPAFNASANTYSVSLPVTTSSITITPVKTAQCTSLKINNVLRNSLTVTLPLGGSLDVQIQATVTDSTGTTVSTYDIWVDRATLISDVDASSGTFSPDFDGCALNYSLYLPSTTTSVTLTPQKTSSCKSFTINSKAVTHLTIAVPAGGMATATIQAVGSNSSYTQKFTIKVYRIAPVTSMKLSSGTLSPAFALSKAAYTVSVPASAASVTITPAKTASCASMTIDGANKTSVTLSPKIGTSAKTTIVAIAVNGAKYTWTVTVNRKAMLSGISLSTGKLAPAYSVTTMSYKVSVPATTSSVKVTPLKVSGVHSMTINGHSVSSITLKPSIGGSATATIVMTAGDSKTKQTYTVTVNRDPLLTGIAPSVGTLSPAFNPATLAYTVTLPADATATQLTFAKAATGVKSIKVNNIDVTHADVSVPQPGGSSTVKIVATATNGTTTATYTVVVKRAPILSGITVTGGTLSPVFSYSKASYTVSVPATTKKVTLKPVGAAGCTYLSIDGVVVSAKDFSPPVGGSITATIVAKTALGTTSTYTVKIIRAALVTAIRTTTSTYGISPAFSATTLNYTVTIPSTRTGITIYATKASSGVKALSMNGHAVSSLLVKPPVGGSVLVVITATAADGITTVTYQVTVNRAA